jgi:hypothetical protein
MTMRRRPQRLGYRYRRGEAHPRAKLSDEDVRLILDLHEAGLGYGTIAEKFEVSRWTIRNFCTGRSRS